MGFLIKTESLPPLEDLLSLAVVDAKAVQEAIQDWEANPPDPKFRNLLQAEPFQDALPDFYFDSKTQRYRYRDTGKFVSKKAVENLTKKKIVQIEEDLNSIGKLLIDGKIGISAWETITSETLKMLHIQQYILGRGGVTQMTPADYGIIGNRLKQEYGYLRGFSEEILSGNLSEAQFRQRLNLYANSSKGMNERGRLEAHKQAGFLWEKRIKNAIESCAPCSTYQSMGWQPIGALPDPTQACDCQANCKCTKVFSLSQQKPTDSLFIRNGWIGDPVTKSSMEVNVFEVPRPTLLAFFLSPGIANAIAIPGGEEPEALHLALGYFGELSELPLKDALAALENTCTSLPPLKGLINGVGKFAASETPDGLDIIYASFDSPDLLEFREELLDALEPFGLSIDKTHGYTPHIPLAYAEPGSKTKLPTMETLEITFDTVTLAVGYDDYYDISLSGSPVMEPAPITGSELGIEDATEPTAEELEMINGLLPPGLPFVATKDVRVVRGLIGADNLINRSYSKWGIEELGSLARLLPGLIQTLDHDWEEIDKAKGQIYAARVTRRDAAPSWIIDACGHGAWNRKIIDKEGYVCCEYDVFFPADSPALDKLRFGQLSRISLGGFSFKDYVCPNCNKSIFDDNCPHGLPDPMYGLSYETNNLILPYYLRAGVFDLGESSFVPIPNLPGAGVRRRGG